MSAAPGSPLSDRPAPDAALGLRRRRAREAVTAADLFLPAEGRLRDDDRAAVAEMLGRLVDAAECDLRLRLAAAFADRPALAETLAAPRIAIARPILDRGGGLRDPALVVVLARHAEEARLVARLRRALGFFREIDADERPAPTTLLAADASPAIATAARALADAAGAPLLPAEVQHRLVWRVAAALRAYLVEQHALPAGLADAAVARAGEAALAGYDESGTPAGRALALARALHAEGRLDGSLAADALAAAEPGLAAATLATRAAIGFAAAWDMMLDTDPAHLLLLCRAADLAPAAAGDIALRLATGDSDDALADAIEGYAGWTPAEAAAAVTLWRHDPAFLDAIADLAEPPR